MFDQVRDYTIDPVFLTRLPFIEDGETPQALSVTHAFNNNLYSDLDLSGIVAGRNMRTIQSVFVYTLLTSPDRLMLMNMKTGYRLIVRAGIQGYYPFVVDPGYTIRMGVIDTSGNWQLTASSRKIQVAFINVPMPTLNWAN